MRIIGFVLGYLGLPRGVEDFNYTKTVRVKTVKNQKFPIPVTWTAFIDL